MHGVLPSEARNENTQLKAYPRMTFQLSIKGEKRELLGLLAHLQTSRKKE